MNLRHFNYSLISIDKTASTNDYLNEFVKINTLKEGAIIFTQNQTQGKGQKGNTWYSQPNKNLTCSILSFPKINTKYTFYLNVISSLAVSKALSDLKLDSQIKWPNDILINSKKIVGILVENILQGKEIKQAIIGIGLNINQINFPEQINATSLKKCLNITFEIEEVLVQIYRYLDFYYDKLKNSEFKILEQLYLKKLYRLNEWHSFKDEYEHFIGMITGIDEHGRLKITKKNNTKNVYEIKTISFL